MASGKCENCGAAFGKGAKFCKRCGTSLVKEDAEDSNTDVLTDAALDELEETPCEPDTSDSEASELDLVAEAHGDLFEDAVATSPETPRGGSVTITVRNGLAAGRTLRIPEGTKLVVGAGAEADLTLNDERVSRKHVALHVERGKLLAEDLGSTNGTFLAVTTPRELNPDDILVLGGTLLQVGKE